MAVETQSEQRGEVQSEDKGRLTRARLDRLQITEQGGKVMDDKATLVCISELGTEGENLFMMRMIDDLIVPNPHQPREYFDPVKMDEIKKSIKRMGQSQPISVVPVVLSDGSRKLFIIDGERRFRAVKELGLPTIKVIVAWAPDEKRILYKSLSLNISRADHNPIELAKAFRKAIDFEKREPNPLSKQEIADEIGISLSTLSKYLEYLEYLTPELQKMMQEGTLTVSAADGVVRRAKEHGEKLDLGIVAQEIKTTSGLADAVVKMAVNKALTARGHGADAAMAEARSAISKLDTSLISGCNAADVILGADTADVLECFFERADSSRPPEVMRDKIENFRARLVRVLQIIDQAIEPLALAKAPGKPDFAKYIQRKERSFGHHVRFEIAKTLAAAADEHGKFMTGGELIRASKVGAKDFAVNIRLLKPELTKMGMKLQECILRRKDNRNDYRKVSAYRLEWLTEGNNGTEAPGFGTPASVDDVCQGRMTDEQRLAAIKAAQARRAAAAEQTGRGSICLKDLEVVVKASNGDPNLLNAAQEIANNIKLVGYNYTVRSGTEFGQKLGVKIEVSSRNGRNLYIVKSNVRGFSTNFRLSAHIFADHIRTALRLEGSVTVDVQDL